MAFFPYISAASVFDMYLQSMIRAPCEPLLTKLKRERFIDLHDKASVLSCDWPLGISIFPYLTSTMLGTALSWQNCLAVYVPGTL